MTAVITGASSGIGAALALASAREGARLFLCGRNRERLDEVVKSCCARGAEAEGTVLDVTDAAAVTSWIQGVAEKGPINRVFANAGVSTGIESAENVRQTFQVNIGGTVNTVLAAIEVMKNAPKTARQIYITASIAGYAPLAACPAYSATKSALKTWGLALRGHLKKTGIEVGVICPGFVRSRITDQNTCPMPFFMEADQAARLILRRADRHVGLIAFPWMMRFAVWFLSCLPYRVIEGINRFLPTKTKKGDQ